MIMMTDAFEVGTFFNRKSWEDLLLVYLFNEFDFYFWVIRLEMTFHPTTVVC